MIAQRRFLNPETEIKVYILPNARTTHILLQKNIDIKQRILITLNQFLNTLLILLCVYFTVHWRILHYAKLKQHKEEKMYFAKPIQQN